MNQQPIQEIEEEPITPLGRSYWDAAMRLVELCHKKTMNYRPYNSPCFPLILAEEGGEGNLHEVYKAARCGALGEVKTALDLFLAVETLKSDQDQTSQSK